MRDSWASAAEGGTCGVLRMPRATARNCPASPVRWRPFPRGRSMRSRVLQFSTSPQSTGDPQGPLAL